MQILIFSGILYLIGIATVLFFRPALMFNSKGEWKEFGIGREREHFSPFPFWMFAFVWAFISYVTIRLIFRVVNHYDGGVPKLNSRNARRNVNVSKSTEILTDTQNDIGDRELVPGYYILNTNSIKKGQPRYVYYGQQPPGEFM
jgi:hypothetical protein